MTVLVPFVIDADSFVPDPAWTPAQVRTCHESLLDVWQRIGLLMHDADTFENSKLNQAVDQLPQKLRPLWQAMLGRMPLRACGNGWDGTVGSRNISRLSGNIPLALVDDAHAEVEFGLAEDELSKPAAGAAGVEVCRIISAGQAHAFQHAFIQSGIHIETGDRFSDIWTLRFKSLAIAPIKRVIIVDRYAVSQHFLCPQTQLSGLERFLRLLDQDAEGARHVTLYSAWTADLSQKNLADVEAELRIAMGRLASKNVKRLKIVMVPNAGFRDDGHDRFVRFGEYVWDIGLGLEVFEGAFAAKRSSASFKTGAPVVGYKRVEADLAGHPQATAVEVSS